MTSIVLELQSMATDSSNNIIDLLRKALIVASKLNIADFEQWIRRELEGYENNQDVPKYRHIRAEMNVRNPYHGLQTLHMPPDCEDALCDIKFKAPVGSIMAVIAEQAQSSHKSNPIIPLNPQQKAVLLESQEWPALEPVRTVSTVYLHTILDAIRSTILEWSLSLERQGIIGEGLSFSAEEKEKAAMSRQVHITNFQGILGDISGGIIQQKNRITVQTGDIESLKSELLSEGLDQDDVNELELAIQQDGDLIEQGNYGRNVQTWIGKMIGKAASGGWVITAGAAGELLATALKSYYGW